MIQHPLKLIYQGKDQGFRNNQFIGNNATSKR